MNVQDAKELNITEGEVRSIHDSDGKLLWGRLEYTTKYEGNTSQASEPTPSDPVTINVATGTQTVTLTGGSVSEDYTLSLGSIELCKIGDYHDYIWNDDGTWKIHKEVDKVVLDGSEGIGQYNSTNNWFYVSYSSISADAGVNNGGIMSDYFTGTIPTYMQQHTTENGLCALSSNNIFIRNTDYTNTADYRTWLGTHNTTVYYALATPTDTQIQDSTLISQLEAIDEFMQRYGYTATISGNIAISIKQEAIE